ncbi:MFS transporter [Actinorhabdospora filicis]|uniref:MFS transporter n=1 Tax=Actinorhabdospora filicis TaxID=1785913 RepID=A0A9W6SS51_9ACTN|nr:MFS transporter [Actinorhabdospora filicis]
MTAGVDIGMTDNVNARRVLAVTAVAALLVGLDTTVVATALTAVRIDLGATGESLEWTVNAYTLAFAVPMLASAALGDRFGRRRVFGAGLILFALASAACALAPNLPVLIAARAVQGAGAAAVLPLAMTLLSAAYTPERRARALGAFSAVVGASVPAGPLLGGLVVDGLSWRWVFWLNVPVVAVLLLVLRRLPDSRGEARLDVWGLLVGAAASAALVLGLAEGDLRLVAFGLVLVVVFVLVERRPGAVLPPRLFGSRAFAAGNAAIFLLWASAFGSVYYMAQYLQAGLGSRPLLAGLQLVPWGAMTVLVPRLAGALIPRFGERPFIVGGMLLHGASMLWIATSGIGYWHLVVPLMLSGTGVAAAIPATQSAVMGSVAPVDLGRASGAYGTLRQLGGAFGVAALVAVFAANGSVAAPGEFAAGFSAAITVSAILAGAAAVAGALVPHRRRRASSDALPASAANTSSPQHAGASGSATDEATSLSSPASG